MKTVTQAAKARRILDAERACFCVTTRLVVIPCCVDVILVLDCLCLCWGVGSERLSNDASVFKLHETCSVVDSENGSIGGNLVGLVAFCVTYYVNMMNLRHDILIEAS